MFYLFEYTLFYSAFQNASEYTIFHQHNPFLMLGLVFVFLFGLYGVSKRKKKTAFERSLNSDDAYANKIVIGLLVVQTLFLVYLIFSLQVDVVYDQLALFDFAKLLRHNQIDEVVNNMYLKSNPQQIGMIRIVYLFSYVFGDDHYVVFKLLNIVPVVLLNRGIYNYLKRKGYSNANSLIAMLVSMLFLPLGLYVNFCYGNLWGLFLSLVAARYASQYFETYRKKDLLISIVAIYYAIVIKANYLIFGIALVLYVILEVMHTSQWKKIWICLGFVFAIVAPGKVNHMFLEHMTKTKWGPGCAPHAYVVMGLTNYGTCCEGWWSGYNLGSFMDYNGDVVKQTAECKQYILDRKIFFTTHKKEAHQFFARKNISQWCNPDFQGFWVNLRYKEPLNAFNESMIYGTFNTWIRGFLYFYELMVYAGALLSVVVKDENKHLNYFLEMTFIGGFIFHCFWEAKGQYTISYYVLLVPIALFALSRFSKVNWKENSKERNAIFGIGALLCVSTIVLEVSKCMLVVLR